MREIYRDRNRPQAGNLTYAYILLICIICWITGYVKSVGVPVYGSVTAAPLWNMICQVLTGQLPVYLIGMLLTVGGAFVLYRMNYVMVLIREKTLLPFLLYVLFISTNPDFFPLKSTSLSVFCMIFAIYELFKSYHDENSTSNAFNVAFIFGLGSLLWAQIAFFLPAFWIGMYNFRSLNLRNFGASLLGFVSVYWFVLGWCVWQNDYSPFTIPFNSIYTFQFTGLEGQSLVDWIAPLLIAFMTFLASANILTHENEDNLRTRQFLSFLIMLSVWSFALFFTHQESPEEYMEIVCVPTSILIAHFFTVRHGKLYYWSLHLFILALIALFIMQLWNF